MKLIDIVEKILSFMVIIIIPLTIWFVIMKQDLVAQGKELAELKMSSEEFNKFVAGNILEIKQDIGEIKGELKRIQK